MMKPAAQRDATAANEKQKFCEKILKHQADVNQRRAADTVKEVADTQQVRSRQRKEILQNNRRMKT